MLEAHTSKPFEFAIVDAIRRVHELHRAERFLTLCDLIALTKITCNWDTITNVLTEIGWELGVLGRDRANTAMSLTDALEHVAQQKRLHQNGGVHEPARREGLTAESRSSHADVLDASEPQQDAMRHH